MPNVINCTPHDLHIMLKDGTILTIPTSEYLARCDEVKKTIGSVTVAGIDVPLRARSYSSLRGLPKEQAHGPVLYVVSAIAAIQGMREARGDLITVDDPVRDGDGRIVGARAFARQH
jgi:hypothetical protein